jgi:hypothetical protein
MRFLLEPPGLADLDDALGAARAARDAGLDGILLTATDALPAPLVVASAVAPLVDGILVAAEVPLGDRHPLEVAEEAIVADLVAHGRLVLVVRPAGPDYAEALRLLRTAFAARPFRFEGERWTVPANLPQNVHNPERLVRVTPAPVQPRLELWTSGPGLEAGLPLGLGHLADRDASDEQLARAWDGDPPHLLGAPRARREVLGDPGALVERLRAGREAFGQDWAVVAAAAGEAATLGRRVRPRVQLDRLPAGLEEHWATA